MPSLLAASEEDGTRIELLVAGARRGKPAWGGVSLEKFLWGISAVRAYREKSLLGIIPNELAEPFQRCVPLLRNLVEITTSLAELMSFNLPEPIPPNALTRDNSSFFKHPQMIGHRLARNARRLLQEDRW